jgi:hypothetical protein
MADATNFLRGSLTLWQSPSSVAVRAPIRFASVCDHLQADLAEEKPPHDTPPKRSPHHLWSPHAQSPLG